MILYDNNIPVCNAEPMPMPKETLNELMNKVRAIGNENLALAKVIKNHLFGNNAENTASKKDPSCFVDVVEEHFDTLHELFEILVKMVDTLGCSR